MPSITPPNGRTVFPAQASQKEAIAALPSIPHVTTAIARSSGIGPLLRVFPGSNAAEVIRNATVPCIILPSRGG